VGEFQPSKHKALSPNPVLPKHTQIPFVFHFSSSPPPHPPGVLTGISPQGLRFLAGTVPLEPFLQLIFFYLFIFPPGRVWLCNPGYPWTGDLPASTPRVLWLPHVPPCPAKHEPILSINSNSLTKTYFHFFYFWKVFFVFLDRVSLCDPDWPQTHNSPTSASWVLGPHPASCSFKHYLNPFDFSSLATPVVGSLCPSSILVSLVLSTYFWYE
jgi:hypothetical protein